MILLILDHLVLFNIKENFSNVFFKSRFTTVGKPGMACKQYNSPMEMYSEDALEEIMREGTLK